MKPCNLFILSASLAAGHVVPTLFTTDGQGLVARAGQELKNLDNEPEFEDFVTGDKTPKSRILTGVGPQQADNRWFDWDESCSDKDQRKKIVATFVNMVELAKWASNHLTSLSEGLVPVPGTSLNKNNQKVIFDKDPAFAQMFKGEDHRIQYVKETFDVLVAEAPKPADQRGGDKPGSLRFICSAKNEVMNGDESAPYCGTGDSAAQAIATPPYDDKYQPTIEPKYSFTTSSSITFCPVFFDYEEFPNLDIIADSGEHTLDKIDSGERVMLHEYLHLPWIRNMPGNPDKPDYIGYFKAADYAAKGGWAAAKVNPDNYAWFAQYAYFNNNNQGCGSDVWPSGEDKPNKKPK